MAREKLNPAPEGITMRLATCPDNRSPHWGNWSGSKKDYRCTKCGGLQGSSHTVIHDAPPAPKRRRRGRR